MTFTIAGGQVRTLIAVVAGALIMSGYMSVGDLTELITNVKAITGLLGYGAMAGWSAAAKVPSA